MAHANDIINRLESLRDEAQALHLMRFFKTGPGQYGEGDRFLGIKVPVTRAVVKAERDFPLDEVPALLASEWHEVRLAGFLLLVAAHGRLSKPRLLCDPEATRARDRIVRLYLDHAHRANNWDLVDLSAPGITGAWILQPTFLGGDTAAPQPHTAYKLQVLDRLATTDCLWLQRIAMVSTITPTRHGDPDYCLRYAEALLHHRHDLMHKAVGWMLREMGKHVGMDTLRAFLDRHAATMPRTTLRYAIEHMDADERRHYMNLRP